MPIQPCQHLRIGVWTGRFGQNISVNEIAHGSQFQGTWTVAETLDEEARFGTFPQDLHSLATRLEFGEIVCGNDDGDRTPVPRNRLCAIARRQFNQLAKTAFRLLQLPGRFHTVHPRNEFWSV